MIEPKPKKTILRTNIIISFIISKIFFDNFMLSKTIMEPINIFIKRIYSAYGIKKENIPNINDNVQIRGQK